MGRPAISICEEKDNKYNHEITFGYSGVIGEYGIGNKVFNLHGKGRELDDIECFAHYLEQIIVDAISKELSRNGITIFDGCILY